MTLKSHNTITHNATGFIGPWSGSIGSCLRWALPRSGLDLASVWPRSGLKRASVRPRSGLSQGLGWALFRPRSGFGRALVGLLNKIMQPFKLIGFSDLIFHMMLLEGKFSIIHIIISFMESVLKTEFTAILLYSPEVNK